MPETNRRTQAHRATLYTQIPALMFVPSGTALVPIAGTNLFRLVQLVTALPAVVISQHPIFLLPITEAPAPTISSNPRFPQLEGENLQLAEFAPLVYFRAFQTNRPFNGDMNATETTTIYPNRNEDAHNTTPEVRHYRAFEQTTIPADNTPEIIRIARSKKVCSTYFDLEDEADIVFNERTIKQTDEMGRTAVHWAALMGDYKGLERLLLIDGAKEMLYKKDKSGYTPLELAEKNRLSFEYDESNKYNKHLLHDEVDGVTTTMYLRNSYKETIELIKAAVDNNKRQWIEKLEYNDSKSPYLHSRTATFASSRASTPLERSNLSKTISTASTLSSLGEFSFNSK